MDRRDYASDESRAWGWFKETCAEEGTTLILEMVVCPSCNGHGKYVNPSIDSHGISREEFDMDPDFEESYWRGDYDVMCEECQGRNVVEGLVDCPENKEALKRWENWQADMWADRQIQRMESAYY